MKTFIGEHIVKIDDKGRVIFPSAFKSLFTPNEIISFIVKKDIFEDCLTMCTPQQWEEESQNLKSRLNLYKREHATFWREYMRDRAQVEPDGKIGRITIPKKLLSQIGAEKELVFAGNDFKIEIWAREKYESSKISQEEFINLAEEILG